MTKKYRVATTKVGTLSLDFVANSEAMAKEAFDRYIEYTRLRGYDAWGYEADWSDDINITYLGDKG